MTEQKPQAASRAEAIAQLTATGEAFELGSAEQYGRTVRAFVTGPQTLGALFEQARSDATFFVYGDERLTFEQAFARAARVAHALRERCNVAPGDRVAISMRNYPEWPLAFMATTSIGAVAVAMNALWQGDEMVYALKDSGAKVLIADGERLARFAPVADQLPDLRVVGTRLGDQPLPSDAWAFDALIDESATAGMPAVAVAPNDDATMFYTSGSTGHPKGAVSTHRNVLSALMSWELDAQAAARVSGVAPPELPYQPATLLAVPLFHVTGSHAVYLASYRGQRKIVSMHKWDPEEAAQLIEREQISSFIAPAAMTGDLVVASERTRCDLSTLLAVGGGGAPRAPEQVRDIDRAFAAAMPGTGWGMTETNGIGTGIGGPDYLERPSSSGRVSAVLDIKVVDEAGQTLPAGERGELLIRGASVIRGYWNRDDANAETFDDDWLKTGDVAYIDDEGFLFIVDRIKDLVIRGGENIGCGEVEAALLEHPAILEACVYGVPDERLGEEVGASYFADTALSEAALRDFLGARLARFKVPRYLTASPEPLPRTASGKILKRALRDAAAGAD
ncbi:MAG: class I adenylate-forming enzyme family protein [Pseudomonadota bacterium]